MNSVESCEAQNLRSASSEASSGTGFFLLAINVSFFPAHVARGNDPDHPLTDREGNKQTPPCRSPAQGIKPNFESRMPRIICDDQWLVEEYRFALLGRYLVTAPIFRSVPAVPIESKATCEKRVEIRCHAISILPSYTNPRSTALFDLTGEVGSVIGAARAGIDSDPGPLAQGSGPGGVRAGCGDLVRGLTLFHPALQ